MKEHYKIKGNTEKIEVNIEKLVSSKFNVMSDYMGISVSELVNTAMKRFIAVHKDFFPKTYKKPTK